MWKELLKEVVFMVGLVGFIALIMGSLVYQDITNKKYEIDMICAQQTQMNKFCEARVKELAK